MKVTWLQVMEAEERTALLERMIKHGLSTGDVRKEVRKQQMTRRTNRDDDTGSLLMKNKLKDSRREEKKNQEGEDRVEEGTGGDNRY